MKKAGLSGKKRAYKSEKDWEIIRAFMWSFFGLKGVKEMWALSVDSLSSVAI